MFQKHMLCQIVRSVVWVEVALSKILNKSSIYMIRPEA